MCVMCSNIDCKVKFGSGALSGTKLLVRIIENNKIELGKNSRQIIFNNTISSIKPESAPDPKILNMLRLILMFSRHKADYI